MDTHLVPVSSSLGTLGHPFFLPIFLVRSNVVEGTTVAAWRGPGFPSGKSWNLDFSGGRFNTPAAGLWPGAADLMAHSAEPPPCLEQVQIECVAIL